MIIFCKHLYERHVIEPVRLVLLVSKSDYCLLSSHVETTVIQLMYMANHAVLTTTKIVKTTSKISIILYYIKKYIYERFAVEISF